MKNFLSFANSKLPYTSVAIGKFDGMHKAHRHLLGLVGKNGCALSIASVKPPFITPPQEREFYANVPFFRLRFESIKAWDSTRFLRVLCAVLPRLESIVIGYDFCFGKGRMHTANDVAHLLKTMGKDSIQVKIIAPQTYRGMPIHTSIIKELLQYGDIENANAMLLRLYCIKGRIIKGQGLGKKMLYPTINIENRLYFMPKHGVYAVFALHNKVLYKAVCFVGNRQSTDKKFGFEIHILDSEIEAQDSHLRVFFVAYLRDNRYFDDLRALKIQIESDIGQAKKILALYKNDTQSIPKTLL